MIKVKISNKIYYYQHLTTNKKPAMYSDKKQYKESTVNLIIDSLIIGITLSIYITLTFLPNVWIFLSTTTLGKQTAFSLTCFLNYCIGFILTNDIDTNKKKNGGIIAVFLILNPMLSSIMLFSILSWFIPTLSVMVLIMTYCIFAPLTILVWITGKPEEIGQFKKAGIDIICLSLFIFSILEMHYIGVLISIALPTSTFFNSSIVTTAGILLLSFINETIATPIILPSEINQEDKGSFTYQCVCLSLSIFSILEMHYIGVLISIALPTSTFFNSSIVTTIGAIILSFINREVALPIILPDETKQRDSSIFRKWYESYSNKTCNKGHNEYTYREHPSHYIL
jgi:hypothetical protein